MTLLVWLTSKETECWNLSYNQEIRLQKALPQWKIIVVRDADAFVSALPRADAIASWLFRQEWFALASSLQLLKTPAAGLDYFEISPPGHIIFEGSRFHGLLMAETAIGYLLAHARGICRAERSMSKESAQEKSWPRWELAGQMRTLKGSRLTILGFGAIGSEAGRRASLLGCKVTGIKQRPISHLPVWFGPEDRLFATEKEPLASLFLRILPRTDHLLIVLPGDRKTDAIIGKKELSLLPDNAGIYNIGRGNAIEESALIDHLAKHPAAEAFLDVFEREPLPAASPLRACNNAYLMPHLSAAAPEYLDLFIDELAARCLALVY